MSLLEVQDLHTSFFTDAGEVKAVNGVSFFLDKGKVLGIVGESGSGKSVTAYSIMQILASTGKIVSGSIKLDGQELVGAGEDVMKHVRGNKVSIIFQDPMTSLNPTYTIGHQLMEAITLHTDRNRKQAWDRAVEMLRLVNVNEPEKRMKQYPYEFSGGMRQRVMIAMALACEPDILIADEPTTALDVTIQAQILRLMGDLRRDHGTAILLITVPIFVPLAKSFGYDIVQLGIVMCISLAIGVLTPPVGLNLYVMSSITGEHVLAIAKEAVGYVLIMIIVAILVAFIPELSLGFAKWVP